MRALHSHRLCRPTVATPPPANRASPVRQRLDDSEALRTRCFPVRAHFQEGPTAERSHKIEADLPRRTGLRGVMLAHEVLDQRRQVAGALPQRRDFDEQYTQPM